MKVLYDIVKEADPKDLWESLNIETTFLNYEGIDAFLTIYQNILDTEPVRGPRVLEEVVRISNDQTILVVINRELSLFPERILINRINLEEILGLYIPSMLCRICHSTVINELFRCLIKEELEKPEYRYHRLKRDLKENLDLHYEELKEKCEKNHRNVERELKLYQTKGLRDSIRKECREEIPDMGVRIYWDTLIHETRITEQLCTSLLPSNPPTLSRLYEVTGIIKEEIKTICDLTSIEDQVEDLVRRIDGFEMGQHKNRDNDYNHNKVKRYAKSTIIVAENNIPGVSIPVIYTVDQAGNKSEIDSRDLLDPLQYSIIVQNKQMKKNHTLLAGYILLYLAYPLRMHRVMKSYQIQEVASLLLQRKRALSAGIHDI